MTVKELIEDLKCCDPDMDVRLAFSSGDYWGTVITAEVGGAEERTLAWTENHRTYKGEEYDPEYCGECEGSLSVPCFDENNQPTGEYEACTDCNGTGLEYPNTKTIKCVVID